jgi:quercetin dioxygenase-like cupin family protein
MSGRLQRSLALIACSVALGACALSPQSAPASPPVHARTLMETLSSWNGQGLTYPAGIPKVTALEIVVAPGADTGWHLHPVPSLAYILEGSLEISLKDGSSRRVSAGQAVAEVVNTVHLGRNPGERPTRLVVFYLGTTELPLTIASPQ